MPVGQLFAYATIFTWLLNSVCMAFVVFALTVFVGMFTGNIMAHFVFTYIIHFLAAGAVALSNELFSSAGIRLQIYCAAGVADAVPNGLLHA